MEIALFKTYISLFKSYWMLSLGKCGVGKT